MLPGLSQAPAGEVEVGRACPSPASSFTPPEPSGSAGPPEWSGEFADLGVLIPAKRR
jgi:hypothetical protein